MVFNIKESTEVIRDEMLFDLLEYPERLQHRVDLWDS